MAVLPASSRADPFLIGFKGLVFLALWFVSVRKAGLDVRELFTTRQFYIRMVVVALSAALIGNGGRQAADYVIVIAFTAVYLFVLLRAKRFTYMGGGQDKRGAFIELAVIIVIVSVAFLLVSPAALSALGAVSAAVYGFLSKLLLYIITPIARLISFLIGVARGMRTGVAPGGGESATGKVAELPGYSEIISQSFLESVSGILIYIFLAAAAFMVIFLSLRRCKARRDDTDAPAFREERESVLNIKGNVQKCLSRLGSSMAKVLQPFSG